MISPDESSIRHPQSHLADTFRDDHSSQTEAPMIGVPPSTERRPDMAADWRYRPPMTTTINSVITAIDARRPGLTPAKKHLLLFFAQGHHLAWSGEPLFAENLYATGRGVAIREADLKKAELITSEAQIGTVSNIIIRYGGLSPADLRTLIQASTAWQLARKAGDDARIEQGWLTDWFSRPDETDDPDDERPTRTERAEAEAYLASRGRS